jgi:large subunit ribosomal protein L28
VRIRLLKFEDFTMARRCAVTGKGVQTGNYVSHANNKTRRRFLPNLQQTSVFSEALGRNISIRVSTNGLRTIEHKGGLDAYLIGARSTELEADMRSLKKQVEKIVAERAA